MLVPRLRPFTSTIFAEITQLALRTGAINLGQGFPDTDGPASLLADAAAAITEGGFNQYPPAPGLPALREAVAAHQKRFYSVDSGDVLVTMGATEAIASAVLALCEPGDEVVVFEPYYDSYPAVIAMAGATRRTVPLRAPDFQPDPAELRAAFGPRTRAVLVNTPHNPTGAVFGRDTLRAIGDLAIEHDAVVITDEVYEHMTFGAEHVPMATLPGMAERTLTVSSAGKTFSVTGWKIGWVHGPAELVAAVRAVKQFLTFAGGAPFQPAVANALALPEEVFAAISGELRPKRDLLTEGLREAGMRVFEPSGTYFVVADLAPLGVTDAAAYARAMPERLGVAAVPVSVFCDDPALAPTLLRFAFCKRDEVLREAVTRLQRTTAP
ncbi:pyridoxal phosphate-dependent aminotransferase [Pseudonocardia sp. RS11V-5]|uniref:pyridoxal phosphate-dependent aminotransferase n=1 Tax=Pseudonocardia terrae TaxID=2905831 RepID=UPI001E3BCACD|nr:pyridoxal phosphate-dependent aminotransferase [Pseudonocardia terrae]MCE3552621.1 pyridoxal phosphate-dependent aminotransferase [Pseudonocardia terrae]